MRCPKDNCFGELHKHPQMAENIWGCADCGSRWHIILTSQDDSRKKAKEPAPSKSLGVNYK